MSSLYSTVFGSHCIPGWILGGIGGGVKVLESGGLDVGLLAEETGGLEVTRGLVKVGVGLKAVGGLEPAGG